MIPTNASSATLLSLAANVPPEHRQTFIDAAHRESTREAVMECNACPLGADPHRVPWEGPQFPIFILGGYPHSYQARTGRPYVHSPGSRLLDNTLEQVGLKRSQVPIGYALGCTPPTFDTAFGVNAFEACAHHVQAAITASHSWIVVVLGDIPYQSIYPNTEMSVRNVRGRTSWQDGILYILTHDPDEILTNEKAKQMFATDLHNAFEIAESERKAPPVTDWSQSSASKLMPQADREKMRAAFNKQGWVVLNAKLINQRIAIVTKESIRIPEPWSDIPKYTLAEVNKLIPEPEIFRRVHIVKEVMGAEVL